MALARTQLGARNLLCGVRGKAKSAPSASRNVHIILDALQTIANHAHLPIHDGLANIFPRGTSSLFFSFVPDVSPSNYDLTKNVCTTP